MKLENLVSRSSVKRQLVGIDDDNYETENFIQPSSEHPSSGDAICPQRLNSAINLVTSSGKLCFHTLFVNNPILIYLQKVIVIILGVVSAVCRPIGNLIPPEMVIHVFTAVLVTVGTFTLFFSPMFRSKLSEMRDRPASMQNGIIDAMAWGSDKYVVLKKDEIRGTKSMDHHFRCELYWAAETSDATDALNTFHCTAYVYQGMTVKITVLPQSCSGSNRVGVGAILKDLYAKPVYSCGNSGCGECSTLRYHNLEEDGPISFLQGCDDEASCYGQIQVSLTWEHIPATIPFKVKSRAPWTEFRGGQLSQGMAHVSGPAEKGGPLLKWEIEADSVNSSPAISSDGIAYIGTDGNNFYAVKEDKKNKKKGTLIWKFSTEGKVQSSPILSLDEEFVYFGSDDHFFYALDTETGALSWKYETGGSISSSPSWGINNNHVGAVIGVDTPAMILYVGSHDGFLYAITSDGSLKWRFSTDIVGSNLLTSKKITSNLPDLITSVSAGAIRSSPAVSPDEITIYFGSDNTHLYAVTHTGTIKWHFKTNGAIRSSPAISSDGNVIYFGSDDCHLYAVSSTGALKWRFFTGSSVKSSPALFEGIVYFGSVSESLLLNTLEIVATASKDAVSGAVAATTSEIVGRRAAEEVGYNSMVDTNDVGYLFAVSTQGELHWKYPIPKGTMSSPLIDGEGSIYIGGEDKFLYAMSDTGALSWRYESSGIIRSSPAIDSVGNLYIGTYADPAIGSIGKLSVIGSSGKKSLDKVPEKVLSIESKAWTCSRESSNNERDNVKSSDDICAESRKLQEQDNQNRNLRKVSNKFANNAFEIKRILKDKKSKASDPKCLPDLTDFIGKGVDVTLQKYDVEFVRDRIFEFKDLKTLQDLRGVSYLAPPKSQMNVKASDEKTESTPTYSNIFTGVQGYSLSAAFAFNVSSHEIEIDRISTITAASIMANATGLLATSADHLSLAVTVSDNAVEGKASLVNVASYVHTQYDLFAQPINGQLCAKSFVDEVSQLSDAYDAAAYLSIVEKYGTHVIVGASIGGTITTVTKYDPCTLSQGKTWKGEPYKSVDDVINGFKEKVGEFTVYKKDPDMTFLGQKISRNTMAICGGDATVFSSKERSPFSAWSQSTLNDMKPCVVTFDLVPIYLTSPEGLKRTYLAAAVLSHLNKAKYFAGLNATEASMTCSPIKKVVKI